MPILGLNPLMTYWTNMQSSDVVLGGFALTCDNAEILCDSTLFTWDQTIM